MKRRWTEEETQIWQKAHPWFLGVNYVTSDAVNSLEMWMDTTFHPRLIDQELGTAAALGYNAVRVFLPYTVWDHERAVFENNLERFLQIADSHALSVLPVLFDDCAFDFGSEPVYGRQPSPVPGVHNSRWVPCPGFRVQDDPSLLSLCRAYVEAVVGGHRGDGRILAWDLYNEPGNTGRREKCLPLLRAAFAWARALDPVQPLTAGLWLFGGNEDVNRFQLENSDVISLHAYTPLEETRRLADSCRVGRRPLLITEWLHRPNGNTIETHLPYFWQEQISVWQWGMIAGKTQTNLSWSTMNGGVPEPEPQIWQHDVIRADGTPYDPEELRLIRRYGDMARTR